MENASLANLPHFLTRDGDGVHVTGHRIGLIDIVHFYNCGQLRRNARAPLPHAPLSLVHKVIAFYLDNQADVDAYVREEEAEMERLRAQTPKKGPTLAELRARMEAKRRARAS